MPTLTRPATPAGAVPAAGAARRSAKPVLVIILVSYFMIILDNSIVFTGLPSIRASFDLSAVGLSWVQDAYTLVFGGLLLLGARTGDLLGRRRMFFVGLGIFGLASLLVGLAPTGGVIIAARALQGIGAAILAPSSLALLTAHFAEGPERNRAVAAYAAVAGIGASVGLVLGGVVADEISWRAGFLINVPVAVAMMLAGRRFLVETPRSPGRFDLGGAVSATLGVGALVFGVVESTTRGWASPVVIGSLAAGVLLLVALVRHESRVEQPILVLRLFSSRTRCGAYLTRALYLAAMMGFFFFTTQFLQGVLGYSPLQAGLAFLPMTVVNFAVAMSVSRVLRRLGTGPVLLAGVGITFAGMFWLAQVSTRSTYLAAIALPMVLIGAGQGLAFAPLTTAGLAGARSEDAGAASGLINTAHQLGSSLGLATLVTVSSAATGSTAQALLAGQVNLALTAGAVLLALALIAVAALVLRPDRPAQLRTGQTRRSALVEASQ